MSFPRVPWCCFFIQVAAKAKKAVRVVDEGNKAKGV